MLKSKCSLRLDFFRSYSSGGSVLRFGGSTRAIRHAIVNSAVAGELPAEPNVGGGITGASRCICANSADISELPAGQKFPVGGLLPHIRLPIQRLNCTICILCNKKIVQSKLAAA